MESGSWRDCCQSGLNQATLVYGDKPGSNWFDDDDDDDGDDYDDDGDDDDSQSRNIVIQFYKTSKNCLLKVRFWETLSEAISHK